MKHPYFQVIASNKFKVVKGQFCLVAFTHEELKMHKCVLITIANDSLV